MVLNISNIAIACGNIANIDSVVKLGVSIAQKFDAKIHFLWYGPEKEDLAEKIQGITCELENHVTPSAKEVTHRLTEIAPDLLIISTKNKDYSDGLFSLSDTCKIIEHAEFPVLSVPGNYEFSNFDKIVIPIDTSFETRQKGPATIVMAQKFNSYVHILGVSTDKSKDSEVTVGNYTRQVSNKVAENGISNEVEMRLGGNITEQTLAYAKEINANLVVIMTEQEVNFKSFFTGKFSEQFIKLANIPVLSVNTKDLVVSEARL